MKAGMEKAKISGEGMFRARTFEPFVCILVPLRISRGSDGPAF
jgi:hypothetical protein